MSLDGRQSRAPDRVAQPRHIQQLLAEPVAAAFIQGLTNDLLYCLTQWGMETSEQMLQFALEYWF